MLPQDGLSRPEHDEALLALSLLAERRGDRGAAAGFRRRARRTAATTRPEGKVNDDDHRPHDNRRTDSGPGDGPPVRPSVDDDCWNRIGVYGDRSCPELSTFVHCRNCPVFAAAARSLLRPPRPEGYLAEWVRWLADADGLRPRAATEGDGDVEDGGRSPSARGSAS